MPFYGISFLSGLGIAVFPIKRDVISRFFVKGRRRSFRGTDR